MRNLYGVISCCVLLSLAVALDNAHAKKPQKTAEVSAIYLDVLKIRACAAGQGCSTVGGPKRINLFDLAEGKTDFAKQVLLPARTHELRLLLGKNSTIAVDGQAYPLSVPSGQDSGLKLKGQKVFGKTGGFLADITLDFDLAKGLVVTAKKVKGKGKNTPDTMVYSYSLKPVIEVLSADVTPLPENMAAVVALPEKDVTLKFGNDFSMLIPAGAVSEATIITTEETKNYIEILDNLTQQIIVKPDLASTFKLEPTGFISKEPLQLRLRYNQEALREKFTLDDLTIRHDGHKVATQLNAAGQTVAGEIEHFSKVTISPYSGECTEEVIGRELAKGAPVKYFDCEAAHGFPRMHVAVVDRVALADTYELRVIAHDSVDQNGTFITNQVQELANSYISEPLVAINGNMFSCKGGGTACEDESMDGAFPTQTTVINGVLKRQIHREEVALAFGGKPDNRELIPIRYLTDTEMGSEFKPSFEVLWDEATEEFTAGSLEDTSRAKPDTLMYSMIGSHQGSRRNNTCPITVDTGSWLFDDELSQLGYGDNEIIFLVSQRGEPFDTYQDGCDAVRIFGASDAVLMDGGGSAQLVVDGKLKNDVPADARFVANAVALVPKALPDISVSPLKAILNEPTVFTIIGQHLPPSLAFWLEDCEDFTPLSSIATSRQFRCTPSRTGDKRGEIRDEPDGTLLKDFTVTVSKEPTSLPVVNSVTPNEAVLGEATIFTVTGQNLPSTLEFLLDECQNVEKIGGDNSTSMMFRCTPNGATGGKDGAVKDEPDGTTLYNFQVNVVDDNAPVVNSVSPASATLGVATDFSVTGQNLPSTLVFQLEDCVGVEQIGSNTSSTYKQFRCTPSNSLGNKSGELRNSSGNVLKDFSVNFTAPLPPSDDELVLKKVNVIANGALYAGSTATYKATADLAENISTDSLPKPGDVVKSIEVTDQCTWLATPTMYATSLGNGLVQAKTGTTGQVVNVKCSYYHSPSNIQLTGTLPVTIK